VSEPNAVASEAEEIVPGVWHWRVHDERIDFISSSHAVRSDGGTVLIDPLPLAPAALARLGRVTAICLTTSSHQRSTWRLRRELGVEVYAPALAREVEEEPDARYSEGDRLPGNLLAVFTPGAGTAQHTLLLEREGGVAFAPDLFVRPPGGPLMMTPAKYMHDPEQARESAKKLLDYEFDVLCHGHGEPVLGGAKEAIHSAAQ
jgi:glyoxylase-like metal-dependent hydrolase (beta-lactamase superfamily II)